MALQSLLLEHGLKAAIIAVFVLAVCVGSGCRGHGPSVLTVDAPHRPVVADGRSVTRLPIRTADDRPVSARDLSLRVIQQPSGGRLRVDDSPLSLVYESGVLPGTLKATLSARGAQPATVTVDVVPSHTDTFKDGTPDFLRLDSVADRRAFRRWFTLIAESQAVPGAQLPAEIKDCAGLVRYSYREALRRHDATWISTTDIAAPAVPSDVEKYRYPYTPVGPRLFRIREGEFMPADLTDGTFAEFADVKTLVAANTHFISRDVTHIAPGDLLFFRQFEQRSPFHSMIFVGQGHFGEGGDWVVYHTGNDAGWAGEIRHVTLASLLKHPDARWRPVAANRNFLGVYRFNIMREAQ